MMNNLLHATLLYDFYGELLTQKQKLIFEMYYQNDLSFAEIADEQAISRQAVCDQLKRTEKILLDYEKKLKLIERFLEQKNLVAKMKTYIENLENKLDLNEDLKIELKKIKTIADTILK